jgi:hypothetical protein
MACGEGSEILMAQYRTVGLPEDLCAAAEKQLPGQFDSLEALLRFFLQEITRDESNKFDQAEEEIIQRRLRDLGYM